MRPTWDETFLDVALIMARRATCDRAKVGAVLARDNGIITTGYNGSPAGFPHCDDDDHLMVDGHCVRTIHAERNALIWAARLGICVEGATMYLTHSPCLQCMLLMVQAQIKRVVFLDEYRYDPLVWDAATRAGIQMEWFGRS